MAKVETVEVEINGKILNVMPHMVGDYMKFGATRTMRKVVKVPEELQPKAVIMPKPETLQIPKEPLPEMKITNPVQKISEVLEKPKRKPPVKSKR